MKRPMLVAVRLKGERGYKEFFVPTESGGYFAGFDSWPRKATKKEEARNAED